MRILRLLLAALTVQSNILHTFAAAAQDVLTSDLLEWLRDKGAYINAKLVLRHLVPNDPSSPRGIFATEDLDAGEILCSIPPELIVKPNEEHMEGLPDWATYCGTINAVKEAMIIDGEKNTPYGTYLRAQPKAYTPEFWSDPGKKLLMHMLESTRTEQLTEYDELPPHGVDWRFEELKTLCHGDLEDPLYLHAAMLVWARADWEFMVPFYDMLNHSNRKENVKHKFGYTDNIAEIGYEIIADKIEAGGELFLSYNRCKVCHDNYDWFGTPEMFLQFGFVESMPQRWLFDFARIKFDLDWKNGSSDDNGTNRGGGGELVANFLVPPSSKGIRLLQEELTRLESFAATYRGKSFEDEGIPKHEWEPLWQYYDALQDALSVVIQSDVALSDDVWALDDNWWVKDGTQTAEDEDHYVLPTKSENMAQRDF